MRLAKAISNKGYCSRREAEKLILQNKVKVNGELITELVTIV
jgi:23S rRNA pseudouridine2605 synthase